MVTEALHFVLQHYTHYTPCLETPSVEDSRDEARPCNRGSTAQEGMVREPPSLQQNDTNGASANEVSRSTAVTRNRLDGQGHRMTSWSSMSRLRVLRKHRKASFIRTDSAPIQNHGRGLPIGRPKLPQDRRMEITTCLNAAAYWHSLLSMLAFRSGSRLSALFFHSAFLCLLTHYSISFHTDRDWEACSHT